MKVLVSGASGLVGSELVKRLRTAGHEVRSLTRARQQPAENGIAWNVETGELDSAALAAWAGTEAMVHLAGENIASRRWTAAQKERIRASRVQATERLSANLLQRSPPLAVFINASGVGYYGDRGDELLTEDSAPGQDFLAEVTAAWERASAALAEKGVRVAHPRFGMILSRKGGALPRMLPPFKAGIGGRLGRGSQWISWITLEDAVRAIEFILHTPDAHGPFNATAPNPVRNAEFTRVLAKVLRRPAVIPVPAFILRLLFGEMARTLLLSGQRAVPKRLLEANFKFQHSEIEEAFRAVLSRYKT